MVSRITAVTQRGHGQGRTEVQQPPALLFSSNYTREGLFPWKSWTLPASSSFPVSCTASGTARQKRKVYLNTTRKAAEH